MKSGLAKVLCSLLLTAAAAPAQQPGCAAIQVPVVVALEDGRLARGLTADRFTARFRGQDVPVKMERDTTPRRILLLFDLSRNVNSDAWAIALTAAEHIAQKALEQDELALLTFGGPKVVVPFGEARATLLSRLAELRAKRPSMEEASMVNDAVAEGLTMFGAPRFGDSMFLIAGGADTQSRTGEGDILRALQARQTRLFGFLLTRYRLGETGVAVLEQQLATSDATRFMLRFANESGGDLLADNTQPFNRPYVVNEERLEKVRTIIWRLYGQIVDVYRFEVPGFSGLRPENLEIQLSPETRKKLPGLVVRHPARLLPCNN